MIDLVIIGSGPAALSAAIYAARAGLKTQVFEKNGFGGTLSVIDYIENYPGFLGSGQELAEKMRSQALQLGAQIEYGECSSLVKMESGYRLQIDDQNVEARAVIIASGSTPKSLSFTPDIPVSYCAICDGAFAKDKDVAVIGGANSAVQEAIYLANLAKSVTIITHSALKADFELQQRIKKYQNIQVIEHTEPTADMLNQYEYCFVYIGKIPATDFLDRSILNLSGYVITDTASQTPHQTVHPGLFAAGDVREGCVKQVVTAAADGAAAALEAVSYLQSPSK